MDKRLIIKIKLSAGKDGVPPLSPEVHFECPICKRSFDSEKALGGHKMVHNISTQMTISQAEENTFECPICKVSWPSLKSVHGHMRKHKDRSWRGMIAPTPTPTPAPPLAIDNQLASDVQTSKGAEMKQTHRLHGKDPVAYDSSSLSSKTEISKRKKKQRMEVGSCSSSTSGNKIKNICNFCNKEFDTYQALGGHTSHHVRKGDIETKTNHVTLFSFDLNELPPLDGSW